MNSTKTIPSGLAFALLGLFLIVLAAAAFYIKSGNGTEELYLGLTLDLLLTVPIVYWLFIRRTSIPKITVVPVFVLGVVIANQLIPEQHAGLLNTATTWVLPVVEMTVFAIVVLKVRKAMRLFRAKRSGSLDAADAIRAVATDLIPGRAGTLAATEMTVMYYVFIAGKKLKPLTNEFTIHRHSGTVAVLSILTFVVFIETVAVHALLQMWSATAAWILTLLSLYTAMQVIAVVRSLSRRPIRVDPRHVRVAYGLYAECLLDRSDIARVELSSRSVVADDGELKLSPLQDLEKHNVILHFNATQRIDMMYGITKDCDSLALYVDEPNKFADALNLDPAR